MNGININNTFKTLKATTLILSTAISLGFLSLAEANVAKGEKFPELNLKPFSGSGALKAESLKGKIVLVDFWASWCEPCKISMPFLEKIAAKYKGKVMVIGINVDENVEAAKAFLKENPAPNIKFLADAKQQFVKKVGVATMPSSFILDRSGVVKVAHQGFREDDKELIEKEIKALLKRK